MDFAALMEGAGKGLDAAGVAAIVLGAVGATSIFLARLWRGGTMRAAYALYRQGLGRAILLGLEFLVAADIIRTVAVSPTFASVGILAIIVLIRTFLSITLEFEIEGRWPWQRPQRLAATDQEAQVEEEPRAA